MAVIRFQQFGGRVPRLSSRLLPENSAQMALNAKLTSGELRPWWQPLELAQLPTGTLTAYRYWDNGQRLFAAFPFYANVFESALINDSFRRVYYSSAEGFFVTTKADLKAGAPAIAVGIPQAVLPLFGVSVNGGDPTTTETRVYVAILVGKYGEEGPVSEAVTISGPTDGVWDIRGLDSLVLDTAAYPSTTAIRIYRTITTATGVDFRMVKEWALSSNPTTFVDDVTNSELAASPVLQSASWTPPPAGLQGVIPMSGGFNAGFTGRTVHFSEPYHPHAWPEEYQIAVHDDIVGLGHYGNTLVIMTLGKVSMASGTTPDQMTLVTDAKNVPCLSAESIVSTVGTVLYASDEGLISVSNEGVQVVSRAFMTRDEWMRLSPSSLKGAVYENRYLGFYSDSMGFVFNWEDPSTAWTDVQHPDITDVATDATTSRTLLLSRNRVLEWDGDMYNPMAYAWRSKPLVIPKPANFGALQVRAAFDWVADSRPDAYPPVDPALDDPLGTNTSSINAGGAIDGPATNDPYDPAYSGVYVRVYGDKKLRWEGMVRSEDPVRLPSGYKADEWEVELTGSVPVFSCVVASTGKALEETP